VLSFLPGAGRRCRLAGLAAAALAYAVGASFTRPFTVPADVVTALALAAGAGALAATLRARRPALSPAAAPGAGRDAPPLPTRWWPAWVALLLTVAAFELFTYLGAPRPAYPTMSALIDMLDSTRPGKVVAFTAWLALGWYLVER